MRLLLTLALSIISLLALAACGGSDPTPTATPEPTPTVAVDETVVRMEAYVALLEELRDALREVQDPDTPSGTLESATTIATEIAGFTPFFSGLSDQQMLALLETFGTQMQALNAEVVVEAVRVASIDGTTELIAAIQMGPAFAIGNVDGRSGEPQINLVEVAAEAADPIAPLLTVDDLEAATGQAGYTIVRRDLKEQAGSLDPSVTYVIESFRSNTFTAEGTSLSLALTVVEYTSETSASLHARLAMEGMQELTPVIGDAAAYLEANAQGIGSMVAFRSGSWFVSLHTAQPGSDPLVDLDGVIALARLVAGRL